jgi:hypothetical protein
MSSGEVGSNSKMVGWVFSDKAVELKNLEWSVMRCKF